MNEELIWDFFREKGMTPEGIAGLMGNLFAESGLRANNLQDTFEKSLGLSDEEYTRAVDSGDYGNFVHDGAGYGLAQWTFWSRKRNLWAFVQMLEKSVGDLEGQLEFLWHELGESFASVKTLLCETDSLKTASDCVLLEFEKPCDQSDSMKEKRFALGMGYFEKYGKCEMEEMMSNSNLCSRVILSPNNSKRTGKISKIAIHCMAGNMSAINCGNFFAKSTTQASSHYGIGSDGDICRYVDESERAWCTGGTKTFGGYTGSQVDQIAVTIEVANTSTVSPFPVSDVAYGKLLDLVEDIARRNGLKEVTYSSDGSGTLQAHRWYAAKACPGDYLMERFPEIAQVVTARLQGGEVSCPVVTASASGEYVVRVTTDSLNIRSGVGTGFPVVGEITDRGAYTIVETCDNWGKLKSGAGWISLAYTVRV